jgi:hypothetical protein
MGATLRWPEFQSVTLRSLFGTKGTFAAMLEIGIDWKDYLRFEELSFLIAVPNSAFTSKCVRR